MIELRQKLLMDLFREFRDDNFHKGTGSYKPGRRLSKDAKPIDRVYQTVDRYLELGYTGNIICLLYTSPSPRDRQKSRMPSSA